MYIFYASIIIFIIGFIFLVIGLKKQNQDIAQLEKDKKEYLDKLYKNLSDQCTEMIHVRDKLILERASV